MTRDLLFPWLLSPPSQDALLGPSGCPQRPGEPTNEALRATRAEPGRGTSEDGPLSLEPTSASFIRAFTCFSSTHGAPSTGQLTAQGSQGTRRTQGAGPHPSVEWEPTKTRTRSPEPGRARESPEEVHLG